MFKQSLVFLFALLVGSASPLSSEAPSSVHDLLAIQEQIQQSLPSARKATVSVGRGGSGVIVSQDGYVLSAAHVTGRPDRDVTLILHDGSKVAAKTLGASRFADGGMLKITDEGQWPWAPISTETSKAGDWCIAIGHPGGYEEERGAVVRIGRIIEKDRNVLQTDCPLIGGDSGGPLFNLKGEVIGIHSRVSEDIDENFHAPVEALVRDWDLLAAGEIIPKRSGDGGGFLGVRTSEAEGGIVVEDIIEGTAAADSLLQVGDLITHINDYAIASHWELALTIRSLSPGEEITIRYLRNEKDQTVHVSLGQPPERHPSE